jgi:uncharacterized membrane protein YphA (DoxX/SURF4 family)
MKLAKLHHLPARIATGIFIANSGYSKLGADEETANRLHSTAATAYPFFNSVPPKLFTKALAITELSLGAGLTIPLVPTTIAAGGLAVFSGGLLGLYAKVPGMRRPGSLRPTHQGTAIAKDVWLLGIALTLIFDEARSRLRLGRNSSRASKRR